MTSKINEKIKNLKNKKGDYIMKINGNDKTNKNANKKSISEFFKDKKTRWMGIALLVMIVVTVLQFVLPNVLGK